MELNNTYTNRFDLSGDFIIDEEFDALEKEELSHYVDEPETQEEWYETLSEKEHLP